MKSSKKVLAFALAAAMVVTAVPATNAQAASTAKLSATKATVYAGSTKTLTVKAPKSWKSVKVTKVSTSKKSVATVKKTATKKVKVTAVKAGTAKVTVKVTYKKSTKKNAKTYTKNLTSKITVKTPSLTLDQTSVSLKIGEKATVKATAKPSNAKLEYSSSNSAVATVDGGVITGVAEGTAEIKVTATCGTKKLQSIVTVTVVDPAATKINAVNVKDAKTFEVVFDGKVKDTTKEKFKVTRSATEVKMADPKWNADGKSAILSSDTVLQAGTYTVTYGTMTGTVAVQAQKATKLEIRTKKIPLGNTLGSDQKVYYSILDQYGTDMGITSNKLTVTATNMTRNHALYVGTDASYKNYFTVRNDATMNDAVGDKIAVVAYLKTDASILAKEELEIANIYTKDFTFGTPDSGDAKDKNIYVNKDNYTYSLPYTAADTEGNAVTLNTTKKNSRGVLQPDASGLATTNNITFISSNINTIDPKEFKIDKDGKLTFKTGSYASKVTITAINNVTGATTSVEVNVGESSEIRTFETASKTIPRMESGATYKVDVTAKDQYGTVMAAKDVAKINLADKFNISAAGQTGIGAKITADGKYVEFTGVDTSKLNAGDSINIRFVNKKDPTQISDVVLNVGERRMPEKVTVKAVNTLYVGGDDNTKLDITVLDNYEEKMDKAGSNLTLTVDSSNADGVYTVTGGTGVKGNKLGDVKVTAVAVPAGKVDTDATALVKVAYVNEAGANDNLEDVKVTIPVSKKASTFETGFANEADSDKEFKSGETANVKVTAKNGADKLGKFTGNVAVKEEVVSGAAVTLSTTNKTLSFKDGVAETSFTVKAGTTGVKYTIVGTDKKITSGDHETSLAVKSKASAEAATKYAVSISGSAISVAAQNNAGDTYTSYTGRKALKITVKDAYSGLDLTQDVLDGVVGADGTVIVTFTNGVSEDLDYDDTTFADETVEITVTEIGGDGFTGSTKVVL